MSGRHCDNAGVIYRVKETIVKPGMGNNYDKRHARLDLLHFSARRPQNGNDNWESAGWVCCGFCCWSIAFGHPLMHEWCFWPLLLRPTYRLKWAIKTLPSGHRTRNSHPDSLRLSTISLQQYDKTVSHITPTYT